MAYNAVLEEANDCRRQTEFRANRTSDGVDEVMSFVPDSAIISANPSDGDPSTGFYHGVSGRGSNGKVDDPDSIGNGGTGVRGIGGGGDLPAEEGTGLGGVGVHGIGGDGASGPMISARPGPGMLGIGGSDRVMAENDMAPGVIGISTLSPSFPPASHFASILGGNCGVVGAGRLL